MPGAETGGQRDCVHDSEPVSSDARREAAAGRCRLNGDPVSAWPFAWIAAAALAVDAAALVGLLAAGQAIAAAHLLSFGLAACVSYGLCSSWRVRDRATSSRMRQLGVVANASPV